MQARLLLSTQRSGSHLLKSLIESRFPDVVCSGEVLEEPFDTQFPVLPAHPEISRFWSWYTREAAAGTISAAPDQRIAAFEHYLSHVVELTAPGDLVIDVKYNCIRSLSGYEDTDHGSTHFTSFIKEHEIPVLHLIRRNILKMLVSHQLARQTGVWHRSDRNASAETLPKVHLDPQKALHAIIHSERLTRDYREHFEDYPHYEELVYEDLVRQAEPSPSIFRVLTRFVGKKPHDHQAQVWCKKTTPDDTSSVVENWDEIIRALRNTEHAWMTQGQLLAAA